MLFDCSAGVAPPTSPIPHSPLCTIFTLAWQTLVSPGLILGWYLSGIFLSSPVAFRDQICISSVKSLSWVPDLHRNYLLSDATGIWNSACPNSIFCNKFLCSWFPHPPNHTSKLETSIILSPFLSLIHIPSGYPSLCPFPLKNISYVCLPHSLSPGCRSGSGLHHSLVLLLEPPTCFSCLWAFPTSI